MPTSDITLNHLLCHLPVGNVRFSVRKDASRQSMVQTPLGIPPMQLSSMVSNALKCSLLAIL